MFFPLFQSQKQDAALVVCLQGTHARTLGFQVGDKFMEIGPSRDPNWLHVINERGSVGYVPKNYISADEGYVRGQPCQQEDPAQESEAPPIDILEFIDGCIEAIHLNASERGGNYTRGEHDALHKLVELRQDWYSKCPPSSHPTKRPAPPPPQRTTSQLSVDSVGSLPSPCLPGTPRSPSISASFNQQVVEVVLNSLATALPVLQPLCLHILSSKGDQVDGGADKWQQSSDGRRLVELLEKLRECKDDEQQRSWHCMKMSTPSLLIYPIYLIVVLPDGNKVASSETPAASLWCCMSDVGSKYFLSLCFGVPS
ncbi:putative NCK-interacting protein with SH3 domain [Penaeus vannamei]|uniref:Putative NCK-interacting protein with SH3 domain n=1 Tax=Penaeus vannamei TaxID=6689 RepID=A0A3R7MU37_PENVA|nr:putative NCK-interacting protein with SH3 domain [Penaeus vannamei]